MSVYLKLRTKVFQVRWVDEAEVEAGRGPAGALKRSEREELVELRRENQRLRMEREILKKATAFFAKESK